MDFFQELTLGEKKGVPFYRLYINGEWMESAKNESFEVFNPADGKLVAHVAKSGVNEAAKAVEAAFLARSAMEDLSPFERSEILLKAADLLIQYQDCLSERIVLEAGKPITDAYHELAAGIKRLQFGAEEARSIKGEYLPGGTTSADGKNKWGIVLRKPLGVVLGITPFNYPLFIPLSKIVPALAAGNTIVLKPASDDPTPALYLAQIFAEAGLPAGTLNVLTGGGAEVGDYLVSHPKIDMVSFTGSTQVGRRIAEKAVFAKLHLELGGKSPAIISQKADLDFAAKESVKGALKFSGQRCDAISRLLVEEPVYKEFVEKVIEEVKKWKAGDPKDPAIQVGPLINEAGLKKVLMLVNDALDKGAILELGEELNEQQGLLVKPIVLSGVTPHMRIAWEETFGPVVTVIRVKNLDEALDITNQSEFGLDSSIFTQDVDEALYFARHLQSGTVQVNGAPAHGVGDFPFGGDEESGLGREGIGLSVDEMSRLHTVVFNPRK